MLTVVSLVFKYIFRSVAQIYSTSGFTAVTTTGYPVDKKIVQKVFYIFYFRISDIFTCLYGTPFKKDPLGKQDRVKSLKIGTTLPADIY